MDWGRIVLPRALIDRRPVRGGGGRWKEDRRRYAGPDECDLLPEQFILCSEGFTLL